MADGDLTLLRLQSLLSYNQESGVFTWNVNRGGSAKAGSEAGSIVDGYIKIMVDGKTYGANRLAILYVTGQWPKHDVDHKDTNRSNNSFANLRDIPHRMNTENSLVARVNNGNGFLGVSAHHRSARYRSRIRVDGKLIQLGWFDTPEEAHEAYKAAKRQLHAGCTL